MQYLQASLRTQHCPPVVKFSVELLLARSVQRARASDRRQASHCEGSWRFERSQSQSMVRASRGSAAPGSQFVGVAACGVNSGSVAQVSPSVCRAPAVKRPALQGGCDAQRGEFFPGVFTQVGVGDDVFYCRKGGHMKVQRLGCGEASVFSYREDQSQSNPSVKRTCLRPAAYLKR